MQSSGWALPSVELCSPTVQKPKSMPCLAHQARVCSSTRASATRLSHDGQRRAGFVMLRLRKENRRRAGARIDLGGREPRPKMRAL